jgi:hypothetical protein
VRVVERSVAMAETGGRGNRTLHIGASALDRGFDRLALRGLFQTR